MDSTLYTNIIQDEFFQTLDFYELNRGNIIFQQDNDPKHTSMIARKWFEDNRIQLLEWPDQSPDLNPIEQLWQYHKRKLATYESEPVSVHELWERVEKEWGKTQVEVCTNLIESMPKRIVAVIKSKGCHTKY